jgi:hypothetical protein
MHLKAELTKMAPLSDCIVVCSYRGAYVHIASFENSHTPLTYNFPGKRGIKVACMHNQNIAAF